MKTPDELREMGLDMYTEPGHATLRRMMKDDPEWALNRLVSEKQRADEAESAAEMWHSRALLGQSDAKAKLAAAEEIAAGQRQAYIDTKIALAEAERFINRFIIHDGEAKPYSVREGQVMLEQAEDLNRRAADLMRDACLRYNGPQDDGLHGAVDKWLDDFKGRRLP